jgi:hypothetical protein
VAKTPGGQTAANLGGDGVRLELDVIMVTTFDDRRRQADDAGDSIFASAELSA